MHMRARIVIIEPFEAYEVIEGKVTRLPFIFKADDGRIFSLFPRHGLFDLLNWLRRGHLVVEMKDKRTGELLRGSMNRLD